MGISKNIEVNMKTGVQELIPLMFSIPSIKLMYNVSAVKNLQIAF